MEKYTKKGFANREEYLASLAIQFGISLVIVESLAEVLGEEDDFDGLITMLEDEVAMSNQMYAE